MPNIMAISLAFQEVDTLTGFVDKTEARLAPGCVQLYSEAVKSTDVPLGGGKLL